VSALVVACVWLSAAPAQVTGRFKPAGALATARSGHSSTLLKDGRVLVAGGRAFDGITELPSVEIYEPKNNRWRAGPPLSTGRSGHTATLLKDGRVLVAGGTTHDGESFVPLSSVEIFDPASNKWSAGPPLAHARHWHSATLLDDGSVLIIGGRELSAFLDSVERYDPKSNAWIAAPPLKTARCLQRALKLSDGSVLVIGGRNQKALASTERFDGKAWTAGPELQDPRQNHGAAELLDGRVIVIGGAANTGLTNLAELWKPGEPSWTLAEHSLSMAHAAFDLVRLKNGDVLIIGGEPYDGVDTDKAQRFIVAEQHWCLAGNLTAARKHHTATLLDDGRVLVVGGISGGITEPSAEIWESAAGRCEEPPGLSLTP
jgi:hypothetical protein